MNITRRTFVQAAVTGTLVSTSLAAGVLMPRVVQGALPRQTHFAGSPADAIRLVLGTDQSALDAAVELEVTGMAEIGDLVPLSVRTTLPDVESITIVADQNPNPIIAHYRIDSQLEPYIATRVRLAQSGEVHALVKAGGTVHRATRHVEIGIGGCGDNERDVNR
jgi:sulfur-oxidizing protein SoxY